jgi:hypothetical protein
MVKRIIGIASLVVLVAAIAVADNPSEPGVTGQNDDTPKCVECSRDQFNAYCDSDVGFDRQRWADCKGGQVCYWDSLQGWLCQPDCGGTRCYIV